MTVARRSLLDLLLNGSVAAWLFLLWLEGAIGDPGPNYDRIEDGLYMGGSVPGPPRGAQAVLNLCDKDDAYRAGVAVYRWEPIRDSEPAPDIDWLREMVEFVESNRRAGRTTYVHCRNGVSRSGLVIVAYEMKKNRWTRDEALAFVRTRRDITRPNRAFMERLLDWQRVVSGEPAAGVRTP
jgi:hypothetical protein